MTAMPFAPAAGPQMGEPAPNASLRNAAGQLVTLAELWAAAPAALALVFVRHFG